MHKKLQILEIKYTKYQNELLELHNRLSQIGIIFNFLKTKWGISFVTKPQSWKRKLEKLGVIFGHDRQVT